MPDRGAPSIKLADGGITRIGLKKGSGFLDHYYLLVGIINIQNN